MSSERIYRIGPNLSDVAVRVDGEWLHIMLGTFVPAAQVQDWQPVSVAAVGRDSVQRIDPPGCGCTDCLTGYSVPWNRATDEQRAAMLMGRLQDATGIVW